MPKQNLQARFTLANNHTKSNKDYLHSEFSYIRKLVNSINNKCKYHKLTSLSKKQTPKFLLTIYELLMRSNLLKIISWSSENSFRITRNNITKKEQDLFRKIIQKLDFEKFYEFEAMLTDTFGFSQSFIDSNTIEYSHPNFRKGKPYLLNKIKKHSRIQILIQKNNTKNGGYVKIDMQKIKFSYNNLLKKMSILQDSTDEKIDVKNVITEHINNIKGQSQGLSQDMYTCVLLFHNMQQGSEYKNF